MSVTVESFGKFPSGEEVKRFRLTGKNGLTASFLNYGATLQALEFDGKDLVLGFDTAEQYRATPGSYQGATIGRFGNRIAAGKFSLNGKEYTLCCNEENRGHLHGGTVGFDKKIWDAAILNDKEEPSVAFSLFSPDGEEGYPGNLKVTVTMTVTADNELKISYHASGDADTVLNMTNHAYFNLNGTDGGTVLDTVLTLRADFITPVDDLLIPDGSLMPVENTPFDFRSGKPIGQDIDSSHPQMLLGGGYDHNFVLSGEEKLHHAATAISPRSGIRLDCYTDQPAVQLYTAQGLESAYGKNNTPLYRHQGFCLETQQFPDSPNQPAFPTTTLKANETFDSVTIYRISKEK